MKKFVSIIALAAVFATPALAGDAPKRSYGDGPESGNNHQPTSGRSYGPAQSGGGLSSGQTVNITAFGGITRAGTSGAMFDAKIGESGASSDGEDVVKIDMSSVNGNNRITADLMAEQRNNSYAWGKSDHSGQTTVASTLGISGVVMDFGAGVDACPTGCPGTTNVAGGTND